MKSRGADPLDYVDLTDLGALVVNQKARFFPDGLGAQREWFEQFMRELEPSRNVVCHMNPLIALNVHDVRVRADKWFTMLEKQQHKIPPEVATTPRAATAQAIGSRTVT